MDPRFECTDIGQIPELTLASRLSMVLYEGRDQGVYLAALIAHLVHLHNAFLATYFGLLQNSHRSGSRVESLEKAVRVEVLQAEHVLKVDPCQLEYFINTSGLVASNLEYGQGLQIKINMLAVEQHMVDSVFVDKKPISTEGFETIMYAREAFQRWVTMAADVCAQCPQEQLQQEHRNNMEASIMGQTMASLVEILSSMEVIMCVMKSRPCLPDKPIAGFVRAWVEDEKCRDMFCGQHSLFGDTAAKHIVAMYEVVEQMLGATSLDELPTRYRAQLSESLVEKVNGMIECRRIGSERAAGRHEVIKAGHFLGVLLQFIFRYLSASGESPRPDVPLHIYLCDTRCVRWPEDSLTSNEGERSVEDVIDDMLPEELLVEHCYALYEHLEGVKA